MGIRRCYTVNVGRLRAAGIHRETGEQDPMKDTEETEQGQKRRLPTIGMRNLKSAVAAAICALIYYFLGRSPAFACIGAIFGTGRDYGDSKLQGGNRFFGTLIGGLLGMGLFRIYLIFYPQGGRHLLQIPLVFIGTVILIMLCQRFWVGGVQPGGVVLCILLFNTPVETYISYSIYRIVDTGFGVLVAMVVNSLFPGGFTFRWMERLLGREPQSEDTPEDGGEA